MDISLLAQTLAAALAPALKLLMTMGVVSGVPAKTRALWSRLRPLVESRPAARAAAEDLAERSEARPAREAFAKHLKEILESDPGLASEMADLLGVNRTRDTTRSRPGRGDRSFEVTRERGCDLDSGAGPGAERLESLSLPTFDLPPPAAAPEPTTEVQFTTYTPAAVRPETWATLLAYCHLPSAAEAVEKDRKGRLGGSPLRSEGSACRGSPAGPRSPSSPRSRAAGSTRRARASSGWRTGTGRSSASRPPPRREAPRRPGSPVG